MLTQRLPFGAGGSGKFVICPRYRIRTGRWPRKTRRPRFGRCRRGCMRDDVTLRPYRPSDAQALRDVCLRTAQTGGDATGLYVSDALMPDVFATPYVASAPDLAFVLDSGSEAGG